MAWKSKKKQLYVLKNESNEQYSSRWGGGKKNRGNGNFLRFCASWLALARR